jgi:hypothetical protein
MWYWLYVVWSEKEKEWLNLKNVVKESLLYIMPCFSVEYGRWICRKKLSEKIEADILFLSFFVVVPFSRTYIVLISLYAHAALLTTLFKYTILMDARKKMTNISLIHQSTEHFGVICCFKLINGFYLKTSFSVLCT